MQRHLVSWARWINVLIRGTDDYEWLCCRRRVSSGSLSIFAWVLDSCGHICQRICMVHYIWRIWTEIHRHCGVQWVMLCVFDCWELFTDKNLSDAVDSAAGGAILSKLNEGGHLKGLWLGLSGLHGLFRDTLVVLVRWVVPETMLTSLKHAPGFRRDNMHTPSAEMHFVP